MSKRNVCEELLDVLADAGAKQIFGVTGDALNPLIAAIAKDDRFSWIGVRHEENAAYAAYAQAEVSGAIGVCAGTVGPGALHLINGLYNAKRERAGVIAITGQVPHSERSTGYFQETNLSKMFDDVCGFQAVIDTPEQMPRLAQLAVQKALIEREVVRIELPIDVTTQEVPSQHFRHALVKEPPIITPQPAAIERAAGLIDEGKKVTLFCGAGCRDAKDEVLALSRKLNAPIVHTFRAKDIFDIGGDENVVGLTGLIGTPPGYHAVMDCDTLIMLGTDFPYDGFIPGEINIIQVDTRVASIGRRAPVTAGLIGQAKPTVAALTSMVKPKENDRFLKALTKMRDKWSDHNERMASLSRRDEPLHPEVLARVVSNTADDDAIFAVDVGMCDVWAARFMHFNGGRRMIGSFNHGSLGGSLPSAIGASALDPKRQVWAMCGDGGFGMAMQDFVTAVRYNWPVKVVLFNNSELGLVKMEMEVAGLPAAPEATGLVNPNFAKYADNCGGTGIRVEHVDEIVPAVERAAKTDGPVIIDAVVTSGELALPPHITTSMAWGFGMSKAKEGILVAKGDHEQWENLKKELKASI